jgi:hypothetical protein
MFLPKLDTSCERRNERGSALVYILIAIALLAALTVAFMEPSSNQNQSQGTFKSVSELSSQVEFIRASVQECVLVHSSGDSEAMIGSPPPQSNNPYPLVPDSSYFGTCTPNPEADPYVRNIRCPGNPDNFDVSCHKPIFSGTTSKFLPPPPALFSEWYYYNGVDGVFFWIQTDKSDAFLENAIDKIDASYSQCEVDKIDASGGSVALASDSPGAQAPVCSSGGICLRVWIKINSATGAPIYQESGCP